MESSATQTLVADPAGLAAAARLLLAVGEQERALEHAERAVAITRRSRLNLLAFLAEAQWANGAKEAARQTLAEVLERLDGQDGWRIRLGEARALEERFR